MKAAAIIVAAGRGTRLGGEIPKQYQKIAGQSVLNHSVQALAHHPAVHEVIVVIHPEDGDLFRADAPTPDNPARRSVIGGATRGQSVRAGLAAVSDDIDVVLIHDAARPLIGATLIDRIVAALGSAPAAAPGLAVVDALWRGSDAHVANVQDRSGLFRAQTPQGFRLSEIRAAHDAFPGDALDDVEVALAAGLDVAIVEGDESNIKITLPGDLERAAQLIAERERRAMDIRTGNGFDVHRFGPGDHVVLCGVTVPHSKTLLGHSDADVGLHAVADAIYGAMSEGDIGRHFPPSDPQWKGADSHIFLRHAAELARDRGFRITNADCTLICEHPKIGPHATAMRAAMADMLGIEVTRVSVKATTSEQLGFTGREEGIAALASVTLVAP